MLHNTEAIYAICFRDVVSLVSLLRIYIYMLVSSCPAHVQADSCTCQQRRSIYSTHRRFTTATPPHALTSLPSPCAVAWYSAQAQYSLLLRDALFIPLSWWRYSLQRYTLRNCNTIITQHTDACAYHGRPTPATLTSPDISLPTTSAGTALRVGTTSIIIIDVASMLQTNLWTPLPRCFASAIASLPDLGAIRQSPAGHWP
jgi:hypothetical protein